jgi:hypothetical protein
VACGWFLIQLLLRKTGWLGPSHVSFFLNLTYVRAKP